MSKGERRWRIPILSSSLAQLVSIRPDDEMYFESVMSTVMDDPGLTSKAFRFSKSVAFGGQSEPDAWGANTRTGDKSRITPLVVAINTR